MICGYCDNVTKSSMSLVLNKPACRRCRKWKFMHVSGAAGDRFNWTIVLELNKLQKEIFNCPQGQLSISKFFTEGEFGEHGTLPIMYDEVAGVLAVHFTKMACREISNNRPISLATAVDELVEICNTYFKSNYFKELQ